MRSAPTDQVGSGLIKGGDVNLAMALVLMMQGGAPGPENGAYLTCLINSAGAYLANQPRREEYVRHLRTACGKERSKLRQVVIQLRVAEGMSDREAGQSADEFFATIERQMLDLQP